MHLTTVPDGLGATVLKRYSIRRTAAVTRARYGREMAEKREILSAEQLDAMTPDERAMALRDRIVTDPDEVPEDFKRRIYDRAT